MKKIIFLILIISLFFVIGARSRYGPFIWQTVSGGIQYTGGNVNITNGTLTASGALSVGSIDGEQITNDTIDDDSLDFSDITFADFDYETNHKMWHSNGSGDVTEITLGANGTFLESNGATSAPAFRVITVTDLSDYSQTTMSIIVSTLPVIVSYEDEAVFYEDEIVYYI